ncbi:DNA mismatch repair protein MutH [[Haemophilus] ducreyi]|uniref:DNA mismatch repair protein MutH n=2 Tax=Haemophilus ducreyi TaxID=730 RepID=MUTH_HAEDU|nr:DNA mismatch repair endonuclease MutH [[Haemophilus] ducreyi]Q7VNI7.1 RecName: Full=DNA mismatch repair protein MutH; AltName: Full=Methyl-directed mismatch repair protein [[Haemophilus] ducreyi 35000HP]AAP95483.1 DNA mismatch repair protein [[Haemophilus] ducreyi 35000HP]AKO30578.1 DNA mismatch repair protein MutH [[Haemophilus] ducreyi]AKO32015.1 DNA mismatch repair protein MutH [[Haemophilus] ducreyi]AKO33471.1 DNA mismatch repair protein MutH [[Haemophilus] ducreyi]AKO34917.1 DNA misma
MQLSIQPQSEAELLAKANWLAGFTLGELAQQLNTVVPPDLTRDKGWVGQIIERALGATAGSKPEQDFAHLGIELKTIPINNHGLPLETTFICLAPLIHNQGITWQTSHVKYKLQRVLWIPIQAERSIPIKDRYIGRAILWSPSYQQEQQLRNDWEELMEYIVLGRLDQINGHLGEVMQLRPKGRNRLSITQSIDQHGEQIQSLPLAFYLRKPFTAAILQNFLQQSD